MRLRLRLLFLLVILPACASAPPPNAPPRVAEYTETATTADEDDAYEDTTIIEFDTDTGTTAQSGAIITARPRPRFRPMVRQPSN